MSSNQFEIKEIKREIIFGCILVFVVLAVASLIFPLVFYLKNGVKFYKALGNYQWDVFYLILFKAKTYPAYFYSSFLQSILFSVGLFAFFLILSKKTNKVNLHGNARFATLKEIQKFMQAEKGIVIGMYKDKIMRFDSQQFVALGAPSRSGKGVSVVVPNLLDWQESLVVLDIKKEAYTITSKYRQNILGQEIFLFSPFQNNSHAYNPLDVVDFENGKADIELDAIANIIFVSKDENDFFTLSAKSLFVGLCFLIHDLIKTGNKQVSDLRFSLRCVAEISTTLMDNPFEDTYRALVSKDKKNKEAFNDAFEFVLQHDTSANREFFDLSKEIENQRRKMEINFYLAQKECLETLSPEDEHFLPLKEKVESLKSERVLQFESLLTKEDELSNEESLKYFQSRLHIEDNNHKQIISKDTRKRLDEYIATYEKSEKTALSVKSTFFATMNLYKSNIVGKNTDTSHFDLRELRRKKQTIYIGLSPAELVQGRPLINLFFSQLILENTKVLPEQDASLKHKCLLLMDEFTSLGQIEIIKKGSAFIAGYNIRLLTIFQGLSQLREAPPVGYGKEGAASLLVNHACRIVFGAKEQEDADDISEMLGYTTIEVDSASNSRNGIGLTGSRSISSSLQKRALMLPQEVKELTASEEIIFMEGYKPMRVKKAFYYNTPLFLDRLKQVSPLLQTIKNPNQEEFNRVFQSGETTATLKGIES